MVLLLFLLYIVVIIIALGVVVVHLDSTVVALDTEHWYYFILELLFHSWIILEDGFLSEIGNMTYMDFHLIGMWKENQQWINQKKLGIPNPSLFSTSPAETCLHLFIWYKSKTSFLSKTRNSPNVPVGKVTVNGRLVVYNQFKSFCLRCVSCRRQKSV